MHLKAIKLRGFKSFVEPVEIRLEPGVAVVVGPNGSGKSVAYQVLDVEGPPHDRTFTAAALLEGEEVGVGRGRSKKDAEQEAAKVALGRPELRGVGEATS